jgi:hypothetical protein
MFRRMLEAAAVNPHDGEAQYQLGLIYQERRQYTKPSGGSRTPSPSTRKRRTHFQLGRIALAGPAARRPGPFPKVLTLTKTQPKRDPAGTRRHVRHGATIPDAVNSWLQCSGGRTIPKGSSLRTSAGRFRQVAEAHAMYERVPRPRARRRGIGGDYGPLEPGCAEADPEAVQKRPVDPAGIPRRRPNRRNSPGTGSSRSGPGRRSDGNSQGSQFSAPGPDFEAGTPLRTAAATLVSVIMYQVQRQPDSIRIPGGCRREIPNSGPSVFRAELRASSAGGG